MEFCFFFLFLLFFFFQAEDGIRDLVRSRGLGDVYKRQAWTSEGRCHADASDDAPLENAGKHSG